MNNLRSALMLLTMMNYYTAGAVISDTLISYDFIKQEINNYIVWRSSTAGWQGLTTYPIGTPGANLPVQVPTNFLYEGTRFTKLMKASQFFSLDHYPISTAVKVKGYLKDSLAMECSGTMIGPSLVLTTAHCFKLPQENFWRVDSVHVFPAFDNGVANSMFSTAYATRVFVIPHYYYGDNFDMDFAILVLDTPLGIRTGWQSILNPDSFPNYYKNVMHKLSYPANATFIDSSLKVNGDTLYYNYGLIDSLEDGWIGLKSNLARLIPGQSGSPLFVHNESGDCLIVGLAVYSSEYRHRRVPAEVYSAFSGLIDSINKHQFRNNVSCSTYKVSPNPTIDFAQVSIDGYSSSYWNFIIYNDLGREVLSVSDVSSNYLLNMTSLDAGIYYMGASLGEDLKCLTKLIKHDY